ncbi:hypothetical protein B9Z34_09480 [Limnohabitans sp. Hippo3]|nr:hypothetical protein B9Z34_09480 [Limnohabitans sp. Hippo3]
MPKQTKPKVPIVNMTPTTSEDEAFAIGVAASTDSDAERLALLHSMHGGRVTLIHCRMPDVQMPLPPATLRGRIKWYLMPWTRPALTPEQRMALKQLD